MPEFGAPAEPAEAEPTATAEEEESMPEFGAPAEPAEAEPTAAEEEEDAMPEFGAPAESAETEPPATSEAEPEPEPRPVRASCTECFARYELPEAYQGRERLRCALCDGAVRVLQAAEEWLSEERPAPVEIDPQELEGMRERLSGLEQERDELRVRVMDLEAAAASAPAAPAAESPELLDAEDLEEIEELDDLEELDEADAQAR
jgi:hypothetical protein